MTTAIVQKHHLIGTGYVEMPQDGKRYRFTVERYRNDDGEEFGRIVSMEQISDVGPYLLIPSWGVRDAEEMQHLRDEWEYEQAHPNPLDVEWNAAHQEQMQAIRDGYDEYRDKRADVIRKNYRTLGAR